MDNKQLLKALEQLEKAGIEFSTHHYTGGYVTLKPSEVIDYIKHGDNNGYWANEFGVSKEDYLDYMEARYHRGGVQCQAITKKNEQCTMCATLHDDDVHEYIRKRDNGDYLCNVHKNRTIKQFKTIHEA